MHHFVYPQKDTFITNNPSYAKKNFGLTEILVVGAENTTTKVVSPTSIFFVTQSVTNWCVSNFSGSIKGNISGSIFSGSGNFSVAYFTGSASGIGTGSYSGSISGSNITGFLSGSFNGVIFGYQGKITGVTTGSNTVDIPREVIVDQIFSSRALIKFNIDAISASISNGEISSPNFILKLKTARAGELPIQYNIFAYPISQSWTMGNGYLSDNGSNYGASWDYKDGFLTGSWTGSTYYTSLACSQSFDYSPSDISMNVNTIVYAWLSGSVPNEGFVLISSDETSANPQSEIRFFSMDTNTIYWPTLDVGWNDFSFITGSFTTESVSISKIPGGILGTVAGQASITGSNVNGLMNGFVNLVYIDTGSVTGFVSAVGVSGSVKENPIYGNLTGSIGIASDSSSLLLAKILDGYFASSSFTGSLSTNGINLTSASITGSWNTSQLVGSIISASLPFTLYPTVITTISGPFINGTAMGTYSTSNFTSSGIFDGVITNGIFAGSRVHLPYSGSSLTASYSYTSSIIMSSSSLSPLEVNNQFIIVVRNLPQTVKTNEIINVRIFARERFPLKNFNRGTQFSQFLTPLYLPTSSYYAIKDNETEQIILDFDNYTQISCDMLGNYFLLDTTGLPQERYLKLLIKMEQSSSVYILDTNDIFKIVR